MNRLNLKNDKKLDHIIESCQKLQVNTIFIIEPNVKQIISNKERIYRKMKKLGRNAEILVADSIDHLLMKNIQ